jgi:hypothetical protein
MAQTASLRAHRVEMTKRMSVVMVGFALLTPVEGVPGVWHQLRGHSSFRQLFVRVEESHPCLGSQYSPSPSVSLSQFQGCESSPTHRIVVGRCCAEAEKR